jgi:hypothetical protein
MIRHFILYSVLFTGLCLVSCEKKNINNEPTKPPIAHRTIIAYLCGDNSLSYEIDEKIQALQKGMQNINNTENHLVVYADYNDKMPKLMQITNREIILIKQYSELNSASPVNLSNILKEIMNDFPANSYGLICFSHSSGWLPKGALNNPAGFASTPSANSSQLVVQSIFEDDGNEMTIEEFANAIPATPNGEKLEFIIFETCYMAGVEIVYELRNKTKYIIASAAEILSKGFADIYPAHLSDLFINIPLLQNFSQAYFDYRNNLSGTPRSATIALINTAKIDDLANIISDFYPDSENTNVDNIQHFNRNSYHLFFDLSDYVKTIANSQQIENYQNILSQIVEYKASTPKFMNGYAYAFTINEHCGLTTYIKQSQFPALNNEYNKLSWTKVIMN